jgi:hypothetical protein
VNGLEKTLDLTKNTQFLEEHIQISKNMFKKKSKHGDEHTQCKLGNFEKE